MIRQFLRGNGAPGVIRTPDLDHLNEVDLERFYCARSTLMSRRVSATTFINAGLASPAQSNPHSSVKPCGAFSEFVELRAHSTFCGLEQHMLRGQAESGKPFHSEPG